MIKTLSDESLVKLDRLLKYHASKIRPTKGSDPKVFHDGIVVYYGVVTVEITAFNSERITAFHGRGQQVSPLGKVDSPSTVGHGRCNHSADSCSVVSHSITHGPVTQDI